MTLVLRPVGRGNWRPWVLEVPSHLLLQLEDRLAIGGVVWRVAEIRP